METSGKIICAGKRPLWQLIMASLLFSMATYLMYTFFTGLTINMNEKALQDHLKILAAVIVITAIGVRFSMNRIVHLDNQLNRYKIEYVLGFIRVGNWNKINKFEYISVFNQPLSNGNKSFDINLWFDTNKRIRINRSIDKKTSLHIAKDIARKLKLDILDATNADDKHWIKIS